MTETASAHSEFAFDSLLVKSVPTTSAPYTSILRSTSPLPSFYAHIASPNTSTASLKRTLSTFHTIISTYPHLIHTFVPVNNKSHFYNTFISLHLAHVASDKEVIAIVTNILALSLEHLPPSKDTYQHLYKEIYSCNLITTYYDDVLALIRLFFTSNSNTSSGISNRNSCNSNSNRNSCSVSNIKVFKLKNYIVHNSNSSINVTNVSQNKKLSLSSPLNFFIWFSITEQGNVVTPQYTSAQPHSLIHIEFSQSKSISLMLNETYTALNMQYSDNNAVIKTTNVSQGMAIKPFNWYMVHLYLSVPSFFSNDSFVKLVSTYPTYNELKTAIPFQRGFLPANSLDILNMHFYTNFYGLSTSVFVISEKIGDVSFHPRSKSTLLPYGPNTYNEMKLFINTLTQYNKNILDNIALAYTPLNSFQTCNGEFTLDNAYHHAQTANTGVIVEQRSHNVSESDTSPLPNLQFTHTNICNTHSSCRRLYSIGGSCCLLLLFEKLCASTSDTIASDVFEKTLTLISDVILLSKYNFACALQENLFYYLSAYFERMPSQYFSEAVFDIVIKWKDFYIAHYTFYQQSLVPYAKQLRSFPKCILLNCSILLKFKDKQYKAMWEHITALMGVNTVECVIKDVAIDKLLRYLLAVDERRYSTYCCLLHQKAIAAKTESATVNNVIHYIQPVQHALIEVIKYDIDHNEFSVIKMLSLLALDLSPCLQKFVITTFILFINNVKMLPEQFETLRNNLTKNDNYIKDILLYVLTVSLPDVRSELVFLITILTDKFPTMFGPRSKLFIKENILAGVVKVNYAIKDIDSASVPAAAASATGANLKSKFQYYKKYLNTYLESNDDFDLTHTQINIGSKVTFADFPPLTDDYMFNSINKMYTYLLNWLNYCVNDAYYIREIDRYNNSNQIFAILIGFISKLNEPNMIILFLQDINTFLSTVSERKVMYFKIILHSKEFLHFVLENHLHFSLPGSGLQTSSQISSLCYSTLVTFITSTLVIDPQNTLLCYLVQWCHYHSVISNQTALTFIFEFLSSLLADVLSSEAMLLKSINVTKYADNTNFSLTLFSNVFLEITALFHLQQQIIEEPTIFVQNQFPSYTYIPLSRELPTNTLNLISSYLSLTNSLWNVYSFCGCSSLRKVASSSRATSYVAKRDIVDALIEQYVKPKAPLCSFEEIMLQLAYCFRFAKNVSICTAQSKSHVNNKTFYQPISMMKIILHLFITKLEFAATLEQLNETLDQFENYVVFLMIASTNLGFGLKKDTRIASKSELQIIQDTAFQVLVYSLYYMLSHYYLNEDKRVKHLYGECFDFVVGTAYNVIDKGSIRHFESAPLHKMFYDVFKATEVDDRGEMVIEPHEIDCIGFMELFGKENNLVWNKVLFGNKEFVKGIVDKVFERKVVMTNAMLHFCEVRNIVPLHAITEVNEDHVETIRNVGIKLGNNYVNVDCEYIANRIQDNLIECVNDINFTLMVKDFNKTFMKDRLRKGYVKMKERLLREIGVNAHSERGDGCKLKMRNHFSTQMTPFLVKQRNPLNEQLLPPLLRESSGDIMHTHSNGVSSSSNSNYLKDIYMKCYKGIIWENISRLNPNSIDNIKHLYKCKLLKDFSTSTGLLYTRQSHLIYTSSENRVRELKPVRLVSKKLSLSYKSILFIFTKKINNYEGIEIFTAHNKFYSFLLLHDPAQNVIGSIQKIYPYFFIKHLSESIQNLICYINLNFDYNDTKFILKNVNTLYYHWCEHTITTFELLNWLNVMAGRSWHHYELHPYIPYPLSDDTEHGQKGLPRVFHKDTSTTSLSSSLSLNKDLSACNSASFISKLYSATHHVVDTVSTNRKLINLTKDEVSFWLRKIIHGDNCTNINMRSFKDLKNIDLVPTQILSVPELLSESALPTWCNRHAYVFSLEIRKCLERSKSVHKWVEFIYGKDKDDNTSSQRKQRNHSFSSKNPYELTATPPLNRVLFNERNLEQRNVTNCNYISDQRDIASFYVKKKALVQTQGTSLLYISYNTYTNNVEAITDTYKLITFKAGIKDSIGTVHDEKLIKIPHKADDIFFNGRNSKMNTNCLGKRRSVIINEYFILSGFWDKSLLVLNVSDSAKSFTVKNKYDNSPITYIDTDKYNTTMFLATRKGSLLVYKVTNIQKEIKFDFHLGRHDHRTRITSLLMNNTLQLVVTASYEGTVNVYSYPLIKHINSIRCGSDFTISNVFVSSCPLPVIVVYSYEQRRFETYTINGSELPRGARAWRESDRWVSFAKYRGGAFREYLLLGSDSGVFELRALPELQVKHRMFTSEKKYAVSEIVPIITQSNFGSVLLCLEQNKEVVILDSVIK